MVKLSKIDILSFNDSRNYVVNHFNLGVLSVYGYKVKYRNHERRYEARYQPLAEVDSSFRLSGEVHSYRFFPKTFYG